LESGTLEFYLGNADDFDHWEYAGKKQVNRRFLGIVSEAERTRNDDSGEVTIKALDYTTLFLETKKYAPEGLPTYSMNLEEAWRIICKHTGGKDVHGKWFSSCEVLADKLEPQGIPNWPPKLSSVVSKKLSKGHIEIKNKSDAWAIWQHCVGMLGFISWIDQNRVIVSSATNYYTRNAPPVLLWGKNILSMRERRVCTLSGKKIAVVAYDPLSGNVLNALWPAPDKDGKKRMKAIGGGKLDAGLVSEYDVFEVNGVTDLTTLQRIAKRVYEERSRQEFTGTITTAEMLVDRNTSEPQFFNLLDLSAGDDVMVQIEPDIIDGIVKLGIDTTVEDRAAWLRGRGYSKDMALLLAKNQKALLLMTNQFNVNRVTTTMETDSEGGSFQIEIEYCNKIDIGNTNADSESS